MDYYIFGFLIYTMRYLAVIFSLFLSGVIIGQGFYNRNNWKRYRQEWSGGVGVSNFLGDLGGRDMVGTDFIWDLELSKTNFSAYVTHSYYLGRQVAMRTGLYYGKVSGDDKLTSEPFRNNRNLNFQSHIFEGSLTFEIQFIKEKIGNIYNLRSPAGKKLGLKSFSLGLYGVIGVGGFYFNPYGITPSGAKVALKPLRTEGQGLPGGPKEYSNFSVAIPVGLGVRKSFNRQWGMKIELTHRFTFTDYIDDVSTVYYDNSYLATNVSPQSAQMANPTNHSIPTWTDGSYVYDPTGTGQQRGDPTDKDNYMFMTIGVYYRVLSRNKMHRRGGRTRRVKASF